MTAQSKACLFLLFAVQAAALPARADETKDKADAARRVIAISFSPETYQKNCDAVSAQLPAELRPELAKILPTYQEITDFQLGLFVKYYSASELKELLNFYTSPTGKKTVMVMPEITADVQGFVTTRLQTELPKMMERVKAKGNSTAPTAKQQ